ncbi:unnamed protein product [Cunninghamella blakesleeana]
MTPQLKSLSMASSSQLSPSPLRASLPALNGRRRLINWNRSNLLNSSENTLNISLSIDNMNSVNNNENNDMTNNDNSRNNNINNNKKKHINNNTNNDINSNNSKQLLPIQIPITPPTQKLIDKSQSHRASSPATLINKTTELPADASTCLEGVIACLDIRTEDGDDVSQNFEKALHSMGAKTRKTFCDNVTHLIFKNGSSNNIKKALSKKCKIVNLLWITNCKCQGKRLPEEKYLIDQPESLALSGSKKRKSMEPGKVKALALDNDHLPEKRSRIPNDSRLSRTTRGSNNRKNNNNRISYWETSAIIPKEVTIQHAPSRPEIPIEFTEDIDLTLDGSELEKPKVDEYKIAPSSSSLRRLSLRDKSPQKAPPPPSQRPQVSDKIKAGFYIDMPKSISSPSLKSISSDIDMITLASASNNNYDNDNDINNNEIDADNDIDIYRNTNHNNKKNNNAIFNNNNNNDNNNITDIPLSLSPHLKNTNIFASSVTSSYQPLSSSTTTLRRRRRSLVNKSNKPFVLTSRPRLSIHSNHHLPSESAPSLHTDHQMDHQNEELSNKHYNIVLTSMTEKEKRKYTDILNRLGNYTLGERVDENTTHIIVGCPRRTKSVILGFIYATWLVTADWLIDSDKKNKYLDELRYECIVFFPRARAARLREPLFPSNVNVYVESTALDEDLANLLITKAGANVVADINEANIVINNSYVHPDVITVRENWLLDSIEHWRYLSTSKYQPTIK